MSETTVIERATLPEEQEPHAERGYVAEICEDGPRFFLSRKGMNSISADKLLIGRMKSARDQARRDAIKNLARYKFSNFGYHAARWVTLNKIIGDKLPNPFAAFVVLARELLRPVVPPVAPQETVPEREVSHDQ